MTAIVVGGIFQLDEGIKVAFEGRLVGQLDILSTSLGVLGVLGERGIGGDGVEFHGDVLVALLEDKDGARHIARLLLLVVWKILDGRSNQELVCEVVNLLVRNIG